MDQDKVEAFLIKKAHAWIMAFIAIATPAVTAYAAYQSSIKALDDKIVEVKISMAKDSVSKDDLSEMKQMLMHMNESQVLQGQDIARIKGLLERRR